MRDSECVKGVAVWGNGSSLDTKSLSLVTGFSYFAAEYCSDPAAGVLLLSCGARLDCQHLRHDRFAVRIGQVRIYRLRVLESHRVYKVDQVISRGADEEDRLVGREDSRNRRLGHT